MAGHIPGIGFWGVGIYRVYTVGLYRYIDIPGMYRVYTLLSIWAGPPPQPLAHPPTPSTHKPWLMHKHVQCIGWPHMHHNQLQLVKASHHTLRGTPAAKLALVPPKQHP